MPIADLLEKKADLAMLQDIYNTADQLGLDQIYHTGTYKQANDPSKSPLENYSAPFINKQYKPTLFDAREVPASTLPSGLGAVRLPYDIRGVNMENLMADNQSAGSSIFNGIYSRYLLNTADKVGAGIGYLGGLVGIGNNHAAYGEGLDAWIAGAADNAMAKSFRERETEQKAYNPIYQETEDVGKGFWSRAVSDLNFWTEDTADALAFMTSSLIPTMAISKAALGARAVAGLAKLTGKAASASELAAASDAFAGSLEEATTLGGSVGEAARAVKGISNAALERGINYSVNSFLTIPVESMVESLQVRDSVLEKLNTDPAFADLPQDEKMRRAAEAASNTFKSNLLALLPSNLWESSFIFKKLPSANNQLQREFLKKSLLSAPEALKPTMLKRLGNFAKDAGEGILAEGLYEENIQLAISRLNEEYAYSPDKKGSYLSDLINQYTKQTGEAFAGNDIEASTSIGLGGLIGGLMGGSSSVMKSRREDKLSNQITKNIGKLSTEFAAIGNIYETEADGSLKLNEQGNPIINKDKFIETLGAQSRVLELDDLKHAAMEGQLPFLADIYEKELFSRFAEAHFRNGLGDILLDKLQNVASLSKEDLKALGLDPDSSANAPTKVAEYKDLATKLQRAYDEIENNIVSKYDANPRKRDLFLGRKQELYRLSARNIIVDSLLQKTNNEVTSLTSKLNSYDSMYNSASDPIVNTANQKLLTLKAAERHYNTLLDASESARQYGEFADEEAIKEAKNNLKEVTDDYKEFSKENEEELSKLQQSEEGLYKYAKKSKNILPETKTLKLAQLRQAELKLSRNSVIQRLSVLANPVSGQTFYDKNINKVNESKNYKPRGKESLKDKTLDDYLSYETKRTRSKKVSNQLTDIEAEFTGSNLIEAIKTSPLDDISNFVNELINVKGSVNKESLDEIIPIIEGKVNTQLQENEKKIGELNDEIDQLSNREDEYGPVNPTEEEFNYITSLENQVSQIQDSSDRYLELKNNIKNKINIYTTGEYTPNNIKRLIADEYLPDSEQIISDMEQTDEGYNTESDLNRVQEELESLKKLKTLFEERKDDVLSSTEFKGFINDLNTRIDKLTELVTIIENRVSDRKAKNQQVLVDKVTLTESSVNSAIPPIEKLLSNLYGSQYSNAKTKAEASKDPIEKLAALETIQSLISQAYTTADAKTKKEFDDEIKKLKDSIISQIEANPILQRRNLSSQLALYKNNPLFLFYTFLNQGLSQQSYTKDFTKGSAVNKFITTGELLDFKKNVETEDRTGSTTSKEELLALIDLHISYVGLNELDLIKETGIYTLSEIQREIEVAKDDKLLTPSNQQLFSLRELVDFFRRIVPNDWFSDIAYLKAPAGAGKSQIVGQWLPKLLNLKTEEVYAIGYNSTASGNINKILGKEGGPVLNDLVTALKNDTKLKLIIVDEIGFFSKKDLLILANAIKLRNENSTIKVKAVLLGDPNQLNIDEDGKLVGTPDIELRATTKPHFDSNKNLLDYGFLINNLTPISPLTVRYRSNVNQISNFSDKFIAQTEDLSKSDIITKSNNPNLTPSTLQDEDLKGVVGTSNFIGDVLKILANSDLEDGRSRAIITNPSNVEPIRKILLDKGITLDKVNVVSYIDVQGQTINEVYVDIRNTSEFVSPGESQNRLYNKAMYVATSRATDFILVSNFEIQNELDSTIAESQTNNEEQLKESKKLFNENRILEEKTVTNLLGTTVNNVPQAPKEKEETKPTPTSPVDELTQEAQEVEDFPPTESYSEEELPQTPAEKVKEFTGTVVDKAKEFVQNLLFPSHVATKNQITLDGEPMEVSDKALAKLEGYSMISPSVKLNDDVFYTPIARGKQIFIGVYTPEKDDTGKIIPNKYRQVGVLSTQDINDLKTNPDAKELASSIQKVLDNPDTTPVAVISGNEYYVNNATIEQFSIAKGKVANIRHLRFTYDPRVYTGFGPTTLRDLIQKFADGFFPKGYDIEPIVKSSRIIIFSGEDLKRNKDDFSGTGVLPGIPYLVLSDLKQTNARKTPKKMFIRLDRRVLNKTVHQQYLQPIFDFIATAKKLNKLISNDNVDFSYGNTDFNKLVVKISQLNTTTEVSELLKEIEQTKDTTYTPEQLTDIITESRDLYNLWRQPKSKFISKGNRVNSKSTEFTVVQKYKTTKDGHKAGDLYQAKKAGKVTEVEKDALNSPTKVKIFWTVLEDGKAVDKEEWFPIEDIETSGTDPGPAQRLTNQIWKGHKSTLSKIEDFPVVDSEDTIDEEGETLKDVKVFNAPSLMGSKWQLPIEFYEDIFNFDSSGNSIIDLSKAFDREVIFSLRIPVPRKTLGVDFTDSETNSANDSQVTSFYLQSNFKEVTPTAISVKFEKAPAAKPAPKTETKTEETPTPAEEKVVKESTGPSTARSKAASKNRRRLSGEVVKESELGKKLTQKQVLKKIAKIFPNVKDLTSHVKFVSQLEMIKLNGGVFAWGLFKDNMIYLHENPDQTVYSKVVFHEVFHLAFNTLLTQKEKDKIESIVRDQFPKTQFLNKEEFEEFVDEHLANLYMEKDKSGVHHYLKMILEKIKKFLNFTAQNIDSVEKLFDAIDSGALSTRFGTLDDITENYIQDSIKEGTIKQKC